ncbi:hypothetical protein LY76DRAFT_630997 [Colletotrichum caudatum]|nr:hypothetical protein LY76DRAFT_630997 [Colletotrichum caudatum]
MVVNPESMLPPHLAARHTKLARKKDGLLPRFRIAMVNVHYGLVCGVHNRAQRGGRQAVDAGESRPRRISDERALFPLTAPDDGPNPVVPPARQTAQAGTTRWKERVLRSRRVLRRCRQRVRSKVPLACAGVTGSGATAPVSLGAEQGNLANSPPSPVERK